MDGIRPLILGVLCLGRVLLCPVWASSFLEPGGYVVLFRDQIATLVNIAFLALHVIGCGLGVIAAIRLWPAIRFKPRCYGPLFLIAALVILGTGGRLLYSFLAPPLLGRASDVYETYDGRYEFQKPSETEPSPG